MHLTVYNIDHLGLFRRRHASRFRETDSNLCDVVKLFEIGGSEKFRRPETGHATNFHRLRKWPGESDDAKEAYKRFLKFLRILLKPFCQKLLKRGVIVLPNKDYVLSNALGTLLLSDIINQLYFVVVIYIK